MTLAGTTYTGPPPDDPEILQRLPEPLQKLLGEANGFVAYDGGLHVRGACTDPPWHSLRHAWEGDTAFHRIYPAVEATDIPFAQDAVGDQWLLRGGQVLSLAAETGDVDALDMDLDEFLRAVQADPVELLGLHPLIQLQSEGGELRPGELISVYPPFCTVEAANGVSLRAVPAEECLAFLANLSRQLPADGAFTIDVD